MMLVRVTAIAVVANNDVGAANYPAAVVAHILLTYCAVVATGFWAHHNRVVHLLLLYFFSVVGVGGVCFSDGGCLSNRRDGIS